MFEPIKLRIDRLRLHSMANKPMHHMVKARIAKGYRAAVRMAWVQAGKPRIVAPAEVLLTRIAPHKLDSDNLVSCFKNFRDEVAAIAGIDDRHDERIHYSYAQRKDPTPRTYAIEIDIFPMTKPVAP